jgi:hypothetical protein
MERILFWLSGAGFGVSWSKQYGQLLVCLFPEVFPDMAEASRASDLTWLRLRLLDFQCPDSGPRHGPAPFEAPRVSRVFDSSREGNPMFVPGSSPLQICRSIRRVVRPFGFQPTGFLNISMVRNPSSRELHGFLTSLHRTCLSQWTMGFSRGDRPSWAHHGRRQVGPRNHRCWLVIQ